jgi:WD40 repeat protein
LPERYRDALLLCYLEGQTRDQAARQLGWSLRTLHRRLERGLELLRTRLTARGLGLFVALLAAGISQQTASRACSAILLRTTIRAALRFAAETSEGAAVSTVVASLAEVGATSLTAAKVKFATILLLALGELVGAAALAHQALDTGQPQAKTEPLKSKGKHAEPPPRTDREGVPLPPGAIARLGTTRLRPMASELAFRDDRTLITCGSGRIVRFWDVATGKVKRIRELPGPSIASAFPSPDGSRIAVADTDGLSVWDTERGVRLHQFRLRDDRILSGIAFSTNGRYLAAAEYAGMGFVHVWDLNSGESRMLGQMPQYVALMTFSPDGKRLVLAVEDRTLRCWDVGSGKELWKRPQRPRGLGFSPDGRILAVGDPSDQTQVHLIDAATGKPLDEHQFPGVRGVFRVHFSPEGKTLAIGTERGIVLWDLAAGKQRHFLDGANFTFAFAPDSKSLVSLGPALQRWEVATGKPMYEDTRTLGHTDAVGKMAWSPDGRSLASIGGGNYSSVYLWSVPDSRLLHRLTVESKGQWPGWRFGAFSIRAKTSCRVLALISMIV